jgi:hypothetical protein
MQCLKCGHRFAPGAPEPSWCPGCGELCSAYDVPDEPPEPDEIPETPQDQRRLTVWFWVLFVGGPVGAGLAFLFGSQLPSLLPAALQPLALAGMEPLLALLAGAGGAGFCLARMRCPRRSLGAQLVFGAAMGGALLFAYLGLAAVISAFVYIIVYKIGKLGWQ